MTYVNHLSKEIHDCCQDLQDRIGFIIYCGDDSGLIKVGLPDPHHWTKPMANNIVRFHGLRLQPLSLVEARQIEDYIEFKHRR